MPSNKETIKKCYKIFVNENLWSTDKQILLRNFRKWSLMNHPDKVGPNEKYSIVSNCKTIIKKILIILLILPLNHHRHHPQNHNQHHQ